MSAIAVNLVGKAYVDHQATLAERARVRAQLGQLNTELALRIFRLDDATKTMTTATGQPDWMGGHAQDFYNNAALELHSAVTGEKGYTPSSPTYVDVHLVSLLQQMDLLSSDQLSQVDLAKPGTPPEVAGPADAALKLEDVTNIKDVILATRAKTMAAEIHAYATQRRFQYYCSPNAPGRDDLVMCAKTPADVARIEQRAHAIAEAAN